MREAQAFADPSGNTGRRGLEARRTAHECQFRLQMGLTGEVYTDLVPGPTSRGYDLISLSTGNLKRSTDNFKGATGAETEKAMAPHSSTLAWKIPWLEDPGRLQSMALLQVRHD